MGFIEDRIAERERLNINRRVILDSVSSVWDGLSAAVIEDVKAYREKYGQNSVLTNDTWEHYNLRIPEEIINGTPIGTKDTLVISRAQNNPIITAGDLKFECKICEEGIVCLTFDGKEISFKDASAKILDPFLFPDLPRLP